MILGCSGFCRTAAPLLKGGARATEVASRLPLGYPCGAPRRSWVAPGWYSAVPVRLPVRSSSTVQGGRGQCKLVIFDKDGTLLDDTLTWGPVIEKVS